ncbi:hypothetical protein RK59_024280 [Shigella flexneri]|nr:hypothetical protein RK59_024280 [Shigella flexneri]
MLPSETMIWQPEFTDKTLSRKPGAVHITCPAFTVRTGTWRIATNRGKPLAAYRCMVCPGAVA